METRPWKEIRKSLNLTPEEEEEVRKIKEEWLREARALLSPKALREFEAAMKEANGG